MSMQGNVIALNGKKNMCGKRIREARKLQGLGIYRMSQESLALIISRQGYPMTRITVGRIENGTREVNDVEIVHFAKALNIDVHTLLCGKKTAAELVGSNNKNDPGPGAAA